MLVCHLSHLQTSQKTAKVTDIAFSWLNGLPKLQWVIYVSNRYHKYLIVYVTDITVTDITISYFNGLRISQKKN